jgi:hypothetical protein
MVSRITAKASWSQIVGSDQIARVDVLAFDELVDLDRACRLQRDVLEFVLRHLEIGVFVDLISLDDVLARDFLAGVRVDAYIANAMPGLLVDLVEADLLGIGGGGIQRDGTGHEREPQKTFPIGRARPYATLRFGLLDSRRPSRHCSDTSPRSS